MENRNPYAAPRTNVAKRDAPEEYGEVKIFSVSGRLGRMRYLGYFFGLSFLLLALVAAVATVSPDPSVAAVVGIACYVAMLVLQFMLTIQRAHDMNTSGWLSLILLIPLAGFVFWLVPGTKGQNNYGPPPPPNTIGVILLGCMLPVLFVSGILAAVAIPAYQDYSIRAQVIEGLALAEGPKSAVAQAFLRTNSAPSDRVDAGMSADATDTAGKYVEGVEVYRGTVFVVYGESAHPTIAGRVVALQPYALGADVVWRCAAGPAPRGAVQIDAYAPDSATETDIAPRYLPTACRP